MDRFALMQTFVRIVETGTISGVAKEFGTTQPTISKQLAALESQVGVTLLQRTTRRLHVTEAGAAYYESAKRILEDVADLDTAVGRLSASPVGTLTISAPHALGRPYLYRWLHDFHRMHPQLKLQVLYNERYVDLVEDGIDVAIRIGALRDSSLVARRLGAGRRVIVAAPDYLARAGTLQHPDDLQNHACLLFSGLSTGFDWIFTGPNGDLRVRVGGPVRTNSGDQLRTAAVAGVGVAALPSWIVSAELQSGALVEVLRDWCTPPSEINAVYPSARRVPVKVRAFVDFLKERFAGVAELQ
ncbi:MAG: LysR family transcriptional regulator [Burkholderiales bacterium]|nr:LysR family transcriptional regulator [Burkholderiales bacterium]